MNINKVSPEDWGKLVQSVTDSCQQSSRMKSKNLKGHLYIVFKNGQLTTCHAEGLKEKGVSKLSVFDIEKITNAKIQQLKADSAITITKIKTFNSIVSFSRILNSKLKGHDKIGAKIMRVLTVMTRYCAFLISPFLDCQRPTRSKFDELRINLEKAGQKSIIEDFKRQNKSLLKDLRFNSKIIKKLLSFNPDELAFQTKDKNGIVAEDVVITLIEKLKLKRSEVNKNTTKKNEQEFECLRDELEFFVREISSLQKKYSLNFESARNLANMLYSIRHQFLNVLNSEEHRNRVKECLQAVQKDELSHYIGNTFDSGELAFTKDMARGISFVRKDEFLGIDDQAPKTRPFSEQNGEPNKIVEESRNLIRDLIRTGTTDSRWEQVIQTIVTQSTLITAFFSSKTHLSDLGSKVQWEKCSLGCDFPGEFPPISVKVVRDVRGEIQRLDISTSGKLDLFKKQINFSGTDEIQETVVVPGAIIANQSFSVLLNSKNEFSLTYYKSSYTTDIPEGYGKPQGEGLFD